jgi:metal-responsive CopG/Arc/MetJ family transcriptional regulator
MASALKTHIVKVTGVPDELLQLLDDRVAKRHFGGRSQYLRDLMRRDLLDAASANPHPSGGARTVAEAEAIFERIESRDTSHVLPLAPGADSREAIYGDRA